jgi:hypothetical protein
MLIQFFEIFQILQITFLALPCLLFEFKEHFDKNLAMKNPTCLCIPRINRTDALASIINAFQNPIWAEQARERLKQIKLLTKVATI